VSELAIPKPDGGSFRLADLRGKVVLVDFWATYCPPCVKQMPQLAALGTRYRDRGLEVVGLTVNQREDNAEVTAFIQRTGITYPIGYADRRVSGAFLNGTEDETGSPPIPQLFILGRDGQLVEHLIGNDPEHTLARVEKIINQQLAQVASSR
jgi:cytochrome c biogenesis protein CcmG/thiol:disulfide interchange protein DsbE